MTKPNLFGSQKILGGTMIAPHAGELIQELILANSAGVKASAIFNKIYPYPTASRVNQMAMVNEQEKRNHTSHEESVSFFVQVLVKPHLRSTSMTVLSKFK